MLLVFYGGVDADKDLLSEIFAFDTGLYFPYPSLPSFFRSALDIDRDANDDLMVKCDVIWGCDGM